MESRDSTLIDVYEKHIKDEINQVKGFTSGLGTVWVKNNRPKGELWRNDLVDWVERKVACSRLQELIQLTI